MKTKFYIGILLALILTGFTANGQRDYAGDNKNDDVRVVVNNYYDNYDYYYTSRINRFHRSYSHFGYYAPLFTDAYWYSYQPYSWGVSIYGGGGFGFGYSESYPVYGYGAAYNSGWNAPYFGSSSYWGYDPFYYGSWYVNPVINVSYGAYWSHPYYGYNGHDHRYSQHYYEVSQARNGYNHYSTNYYNNYHNNYYSSGYSTSRRSSDPSPVRSSDAYSENNRRGAGTSVYRAPESHPGNIVNNGNNVNSRNGGNNKSNYAAGSSKSHTNSPSSFSNWNRNNSRSSTGLGNTRSSTQYNQGGKKESFSSASGSSRNSRRSSGSSSSGSVSKGNSSTGSNGSDSQSPKSSSSSDRPERRR